MRVEAAIGQLYDTSVLLGGFRRRAAIKVLAEVSGLEGTLALAEALSSGHPNKGRILAVLRQLSPERDPDRIEALWRAWVESPQPALATVLVRLGWPENQPIDGKLARDLLALATADAGPEVLEAVVLFARALPEDDEVLNDAVYAAWICSQSAALERLIGEQRRQPGSPALEALHTLVTGRLERYIALEDGDGELLIQAFTLAPPVFRDRMARTLARSPDQRLKEAYRNALLQAGVDGDQGLASLKLIGDEDGLFEQARTLRLGQVLELCERWTGQTRWPTRPGQRTVLERALAAYQNLEAGQETAGPSLPDGLIDLFTQWRTGPDNDSDHRSDDPIAMARDLYLDHVQGRLDSTRLSAVTRSEHWLERLVARLADTATLAEAQEDPVCWVSACAGDAALLQTPISGTPEDYSRHSWLLGQPSVRGVARTFGLLAILCAFQGVFVGNAISVEEIGEATEQTAIELEDAMDVAR
jgi:hypothetical protein